MLTPRKQDMRDNNEDWGILQDEDLSEFSGDDGGVLIVRGNDYDSDDNSGDSVASDLSILYRTAAGISLPGTDCSLPTDIDSIDGPFTSRGTSVNNSIQQMVDASTQPEYIPNTTFHLKSLIFGLSTACVVLTVAVIVLACDRNSQRISAISLQDEFIFMKGQLLNIENRSSSTIATFSRNDWRTDAEQESWLDATDELDWEEETTIPSNKLHLADNCWFKADVNIKLGACSSNAKECLNELSSNIYKSFEGLGKSFWDSSFGFAENDDKPYQAGITLDGLTEATNAIASATVAVTDAMRIMVSEASKAIDESILYAVEQSRDAIVDATYTMHLG